MWSVTEDPTTGAIVFKPPIHVTVELAHEAIHGLLAAMKEKTEPRELIVDLIDVQSLDPVVPLLGVQLMRKFAHKVSHVRLIVKDLQMRIAAATACQIVGARYTVHMRWPEL